MALDGSPRAPGRDLVDPELKKAIDRAAARRDLQQPVRARRSSISELMRPLRDDWREISAGQGEGKVRGQRKYDGTAMVALDQAGSTIYSMLTGTANIWAPLEFEDRDLRNDAEAKRWMQHVNEVLFSSLDPGRDKFYSDAPEVILDAIGIGDGVLYSARRPGAQRWRTKAIPWSESTFEFDEDDELAFFDRRYLEPLWSIRELFGEETLPDTIKAKVEKEPNTKMEVLHTVYPNEGTNRVSSAHAFVSLYVLMETSTALGWGGYRDMPYHVARWGVGAGETYGLGRGVFALPDAQILNEMAKTQLVAGKKQAEPPVAAADELAGLISLDPNHVNYGALDERGNQLIRGIDLGTNVGISLEMADQKRQQIRDIFYHAMLSLVGSPTPSAVEILKNSETRDQSMGPNLARLNAEFFGPFIEARYRELVRAGRIPPPPQKAAKAPLKAKFVSPLARAMRAQAANSVIQTVQGVAQLTQIDPNARFAINGLRASRVIADGFAAPEEVMNSPEEIEKLIETEMQAQQQAQELAQAEQGARAADSAARAVKSATEAEQTEEPT